MPTSSPTQPKPRDPHHVLLMGPPGSFKTTIALQFPQCRIIDLDQNLDGPDRYLRSKPEWKDLTYEYDTLSVGVDGNNTLTHEVWDKLLVLLEKIASTDKTSKTVIIDGLTIINEICQRKVLYEQGKKSIMEPHFWGLFKTQMMNLMFGKLRSLNRDVIMLCHETYITKSKGGKDFMLEEVIGIRPTVNGGIADTFAGFFSDCWGVETIRKPGDKLTTSLKLTKSSLFDYKNSMLMPPSMEEETHLMWQRIKPYWEK